MSNAKISFELLTIQQPRLFLCYIFLFYWNDDQDCNLTVGTHCSDLISGHNHTFDRASILSRLLKVSSLLWRMTVHELQSGSSAAHKCLRSVPHHFQWPLACSRFILSELTTVRLLRNYKKLNLKKPSIIMAYVYLSLRSSGRLGWRTDQ